MNENQTMNRGRILRVSFIEQWRKKRDGQWTTFFEGIVSLWPDFDCTHNNEHFFPNRWLTVEKSSDDEKNVGRGFSFFIPFVCADFFSCRSEWVAQQLKKTSN